MTRYIYVLIALLFSLSSFGQEMNIIKVESEVSKAKIFYLGTQITRTKKVKLPKGRSRIIFTGISRGIETKSVQVGKNEAQFELLSVKCGYSGLTPWTSEDDKRVARYRHLKKEMDYDYGIKSIEKQQAFLEQCKGLKFNSNELQKFCSYIEAKELQLLQDRADVEAYNDSIAKSFKAIKKQLDNHHSRKQHYNYSIFIEVNVPKATTAEINIQYFILDGQWYPNYDIIAHSNNSIELVSKAQFKQHSYIDWKGAEIRLSNSKWSNDLKVPTIDTNRITFLGNDSSILYCKTSSKLTSINSYDTIVGLVYDAETGHAISVAEIKSYFKSNNCEEVDDCYTGRNGLFKIATRHVAQFIEVRDFDYITKRIPITGPYMSIPMAKGNDGKDLEEIEDNSYSREGIILKQIAENPIGGSENTEKEWLVSKNYTLLSDTSFSTHILKRKNIPVNYLYYSAPKVSKDVYLMAQIPDYKQHEIYNRKVNLFYEKDFIGRSIIQADRDLDTLNMVFNPQERILVERVIAEEKYSKQFIGGKQKKSMDFRLKLKNNRKHTVKLLVEDQVPVSRSKNIDIDIEELSGAQMNESTGSLKWYITLMPNESRELKVKYIVKSPKDMKTNLE